jgi:hypothetical protein
MVERKNCIYVYSNFNEWIDFCIVLGDGVDCERAEKIVSRAYDDWFDENFTTDETIADYIGDCLTAGGVEHEIFSKKNRSE